MSPVFAMEWVFRIINEWREAKRKICGQTAGDRSVGRTRDCRWIPPEADMFKLNVDASLFPGAGSFAIGTVVHDHHGTFIVGRTSRFLAPGSVLEAEAIGIKEALSWFVVQNLNGSSLQIEMDSLLAARAINGNQVNVLKTGDVFAECRARLNNSSGITLSFIRKEANKVAHKLARFPCIVNSHVDFTY